MATVTLTCAADVACWTNQSYAAGLGDHLPIGYWSSAVYRSAVRFNKPSWASWTNITKATLEVYISDHQHVGVRNSTILVRRQTIANLWTKSAGSQDCENGFAGSNNTQNSDLTSSATDSVTFNSGTTANAKKSITVTNAVKYYWNNDASVLVFTFVGDTSSDYTELWSREKGSTYDARLVIEYEVQSPPSAPALGYPDHLSTVVEQDPTFTWTHSDPQGDPQSEATVELDGVEYVVSGATASLYCPIAPLPRGSTHSWRVKTADAANGYGPYSAMRTFTVKTLPTVTVDSSVLVFSNGAPRIKVGWTAPTQTKYRVRCNAYNTGWLTSAAKEQTLTTLAVSDNTTYTIYVDVEDSTGLQQSGSRAFKARYGLTTHRKDLTAVPSTWETPTVDADTGITIEYGTSTSSVATAPTAWYSTLSACPRAQYLFWRAWFLPQGGVSPKLRSISLPANFVVAQLDDWFKWKDTAFAAPWFVDTSEAVYGTRSVSAEGTGSGNILNSVKMRLRADRSYILTGLMKSQGNSGCYFALVKADGSWVLDNSGNPVISEVITETREWYTPDNLDVYRYKTAVFTAPADMDVYVWLVVQGAAGTQAWFDAIKLEESTVATPWSPGAIGASVVDSGGVQVDGNKGGVLRYKGASGGEYDFIEGGDHGLRFAGGLELKGVGGGDLRHASDTGVNAFFRVESDSGKRSALLAQHNDDPNARAVLWGDSTFVGLELGPGSSYRDTNLYRSGFNQLKTDDSLDVAGKLTAGSIGSWVTSGFSTFSGWSITTAKYRVILGPLVELWCQLTYSGATLTGNARGNIPDTDVIAVPAAARPDRNVPVKLEGSVAFFGGYVNSSGNVRITEINGAGAYFESGDTLYIHGVYSIA